MKKKQKTTDFSFARYANFLLTVTTLLTNSFYGHSHTISVDKPDTTLVFGNPKSGQMTIFPYQNDNRITFCTQKGSDPELNQYDTNDCMNVLSDGKMESLYMSLASSQASKKQSYRNSPCSHQHNKKTVTYRTLVKCYSWLAENEVKNNHEPVSKFVEKPI